MSPSDQPQLPAPDTDTPAGPYLCKFWDPLPDGWQRTRAVKRTGICLAFDPNRHTVVRNLDNNNQDHLAATVERAGFKNFQVPGTQSGFFARDRQALPPPTIQIRSEGMRR